MAITFQKRQKEMKRLEKQRAKEERRAQKKLAKQAGGETGKGPEIEEFAPLDPDDAPVDPQN